MDSYNDRSISRSDGNTAAGAVASDPKLPATPWYRTWKLIAVVGVIMLLALSGAFVVVIEKNNAHQTQAASLEKDAVAKWWARARNDFSTLQDAVDQVKRGLGKLDGKELLAGCQLMHDTAEVSLESKMPTPDTELTAEVRSMIEDFHTAAHMCLSAAAGSLNNYSGDFKAYLEQAENQMQAAKDKVGAALTQA